MGASFQQTGFNQTEQQLPALRQVVSKLDLARLKNSGTS